MKEVNELGKMGNVWVLTKWLHDVDFASDYTFSTHKGGHSSEH